MVISVFSPVKNGPIAPRAKIVLDPELQSLLEADAAHLAAVEASATPASPPLDEPIARPAPKLVENEASPDLDPTGEKPAQKKPAAAIRQIRKISPLPRS